MGERMRGVICSLADCVYYVKQGSRTFCTYPDIHIAPSGRQCPFYRMDWQRKAAEFSERFKKTG